jgi:hypothetical protein
MVINLLKSLFWHLYNLPATFLNSVPGLGRDQKEHIYGVVERFLQDLETQHLKGMTSVQVVFATLFAFWLLQWVLRVVVYFKQLKLRKVKEKLFRITLYIPQV